MSLLSIEALLPPIALAALVLTAAMQGLASSGHFPRPPKASATGPAPAVLYGSMALGLLSFAAGLVAAFALTPWYVVVIAAGLAVLAAPLVLQLFSDRFVDGIGALLVLAAAAAVLACLLAWLAFGIL